MNNLAAVVRLGGNAELRFTSENVAVCQFNSALSSGYGKNEKTTWMRCSLFGKRAESLTPMLLKGTQIAVTGEISLNEYTNKAGEVKSSLELRVNEVTLLGKKDSAESRPAEQKTENVDSPEIDDDLPF